MLSQMFSDVSNAIVVSALVFLFPVIQICYLWLNHQLTAPGNLGFPYQVTDAVQVTLVYLPE